VRLWPDDSVTFSGEAIRLLILFVAQQKLSRGGLWHPILMRFYSGPLMHLLSGVDTPDYQEAEMAYERLDEALRQLKTDREHEEATEKQQKKAGEEARMRFAQIKSAVIGPIFNEVVTQVAAEGFFEETVDEQSDASDPISLNVNLSEDEGCCRQGTLQVRFNLDKYRCEFGRSTMAKTSPTNQVVFGNDHHSLDEMTMELAQEKAEQFVLDLIAGKLSH
jgi:hypothetical protein